MAAHARLNNEFMEDETYHNLMTWLKMSQAVKQQCQAAQEEHKNDTRRKQEANLKKRRWIRQ